MKIELKTTYSPMTDATGCLINLYSACGSITGTLIYGIGAIDLLLRGDLCSFLGWIFVIGPLFSGIAGALWPLAAIYWVST